MSTTIVNGEECLNFHRMYDLNEKYSVGKCGDWIEQHHYRKVCLQFPDELLNDAVHIAKLLKKFTSAMLFILGDTSFRSCCIDFVAAKHVGADAVVHFGRACLSSCYPRSTFFVLPKEFLNTSALVECIISFVERNSQNVVLLYDIVFAHYRGEIASKLLSYRHKVSVSELLVCDDVASKHVSNFNSSEHIVKKFGRKYSITFESKQDDVVYFYVTSPENRKNLENFVLSSPDEIFFSYNSSTNVLSKESIPKTIKKILYGVEKVKEAQKIGILVATLEVDSFLNALLRIKKLCIMKKKKSYIISVGKPSVAKLANFPEIDLFVLVSCPEAEIVDKKNYYQPIVSMMEVELALNDNQSWTGKFISDFREFLHDGSEYKSIEEQPIVTYADVSLLNNRLIGFDTRQNSDSMLVGDETAHSSAISLKSEKNSLVSRSWKGLKTENEYRPICKATLGREGSPAQGYKNESTYNVT